jgi:hypothetical protein
MKPKPKEWTEAEKRALILLVRSGCPDEGDQGEA